MEHDYVALACSFACDHTSIVLAMHLTVKKFRTPKLHFYSTVKPVLSSHQGKHKKWLLKASGCLAEANNSTRLKFRNILYGCLIQVGCLIKVTANSGLTVIL